MCPFIILFIFFTKFSVTQSGLGLAGLWQQYVNSKVLGLFVIYKTNTLGHNNEGHEIWTPVRLMWLCLYFAVTVLSSWTGCAVTLYHIRNIRRLQVKRRNMMSSSRKEHARKIFNALVVIIKQQIRIALGFSKKRTT